MTVTMTVTMTVAMARMTVLDIWWRLYMEAGVAFIVLYISNTK